MDLGTWGDVVQLVAAGGLAKSLVDALRKAMPTLSAAVVLGVAFVLSLLLNLGAEYVQLDGVIDSVALVRAAVLAVVSFIAAIGQTELQKSVDAQRGRRLPKPARAVKGDR